jgi:LPXTG-motif cell wall-anchored protein
MLSFVMTWLAWLGLAVLITAIAAITASNRRERDTSLTPD